MSPNGVTVAVQVYSALSYRLHSSIWMIKSFRSFAPEARVFMSMMRMGNQEPRYEVSMTGMLDGILSMWSRASNRCCGPGLELLGSCSVLCQVQRGLYEVRIGQKGIDFEGYIWWLTWSRLDGM
jgi:hypothetical protein